MQETGPAACPGLERRGGVAAGLGGVSCHVCHQHGSHFLLLQPSQHEDQITRFYSDGFADFPAATSAGVKQLIGPFVHDESIRIYNIHLCLELQSCLLNPIVAFSEPQLICLNTPTSCFWPRGDDYQQFTVREFPRDPERTTSRNTEHMGALREQNNQTRRVAPTHGLFNSF